MMRYEYTFRYFFNAGFDRDTNELDLEGSDVFRNGHFVGIVKWVKPAEIERMEDDELENLLRKNGIIY